MPGTRLADAAVEAHKALIKQGLGSGCFDGWLGGSMGICPFKTTLALPRWTHLGVLIRRHRSFIHTDRQTQNCASI